MDKMTIVSLALITIVIVALALLTCTFTWKINETLKNYIKEECMRLILPHTTLNGSFAGSQAHITTRHVR
ncbi:MAG: hypothetical protein QXI91_06970 [Candidatus Bathyarchaeia archaeon]